MLMLTSVVTGQSSIKIIGHVLDAETNQPLPGANVQVLGSARGAATNSSGRFEIENLLNGQYRLEAAFIGYASAQKHISVMDGQPVDVLFQLEHKVIEMENIRVMAERTDNDAAANMIVLSKQDIERTQATTVGDLLKYVPGIDIQDAGAQGQQKVSIRGSRTNHVLVLLDGVKLNDELTGDVDLSLIPVNAVERVEIRKGSASAEYGSGAVGGVIHIISGNSSDDNLRLSAKTGSYGFLNIEPSVSGQWQGVSFLLSFQALQSDGAYPFAAVQADDLVNQNTRYNADVGSKNFFGRLGYAVENHKLSIRYQNFNSERGNPGRIYYLTPFARSTINRDIVGGDYQFLGNRWDAALNVAVAQNRTESSNLKPIVPELPFGPTPQFHFRNELKTTDYSAQFKHRTTEWLSNRIGYENKVLHYEDQNLLIPGNSAIGIAEDKSHALFFKQDVRFTFSNVRLYFSPAVRYDEARLASSSGSRLEHQWSPQLNAFFSYGADKQLYLKGSIGRAFRMPTFADLFYQDFRVQGKPDLLPEKSLNRDIGFGAHINIWGQWRFEATAFRNTINDMIVWRLGSFEFFRPYNTDAEIFGQEYSLSYATFAEHLRFNGSYTHLRPLNKNDNITLYDKFLTYRPEHSIKAGLDLDFDLWRTSLLYRHVGERFVTEANTKTMPAYAVLEWTANWLMNTGTIKYQFQFAVFNLLNEQYQIIRDMPLPGREWRVGLSVSY